jgi:lipopolysaccharide/colanic/teichoic acid biosynthesis glycosyltransferase
MRNMNGAMLINRILALVVGLILLPVMLVIAAMVRIGGPGPIIYSQTRLGWRGQRFRIYKFRTLSQPDGGAGLVAPAGDERITRVGSWLRASHLDELPQILNILRGDMRFVGPRPARPELWTSVPPDLCQRALAFAPGLTSPASLAFICEDDYLAGIENPLEAYRDIIYPAKVALDANWFENAGSLAHVGIVLATLKIMLGFRNDDCCRQRLTSLLDQASSGKVNEKGESVGDK